MSICNADTSNETHWLTNNPFARCLTNIIHYNCFISTRLINLKIIPCSLIYIQRLEMNNLGHTCRWFYVMALLHAICSWQIIIILINCIIFNRNVILFSECWFAYNFTVMSPGKVTAIWGKKLAHSHIILI